MEEPPIEIPCRICAKLGKNELIEYSIGKMSGHMNSHPGWNKKQYLQAFGKEAAADFVDFQPDAKFLQERRMAIAERNLRDHPSLLPKKRKEGLLGALEVLHGGNLDSLKSDERTFFDQFVDQVMQQISRDETQMPIVISMAFDLIYVKRLRESQLKTTRSYKDASVDKDFESALKMTEDRISKAMDTLGLSRSEQLKQGKVIKSTSASLISGYLDEIERMSVEMLDALMLDEKRMSTRAEDRIERFLLSDAPEAQKEDESDATGRPLSLDEVLARAGLAAGGTPTQSISTSTKSDEELPF